MRWVPRGSRTLSSRIVVWGSRESSSSFVFFCRITELIFQNISIAFRFVDFLSFSRLEKENTILVYQAHQALFFRKRNSWLQNLNWERKMLPVVDEIPRFRLDELLNLFNFFCVETVDNPLTKSKARKQETLWCSNRYSWSNLYLPSRNKNPQWNKNPPLIRARSARKILVVGFELYTIYTGSNYNPFWNTFICGFGGTFRRRRENFWDPVK